MDGPWLGKWLVFIAVLAVTAACGPAAGPPAREAAPKAAVPAEAPKAAAPAEAPKAAAPAQAPKPAAPAQAPKPAAPGPPPPAKESRRLVFGTTQLSSSYGIYTAAVANLLNKKLTDVNLTLADHGGPVPNLQRARAGEVDIALGSQTIITKAYLGDLKGWEDRPQRDVRLLWAFDPAAMGYVVSERSGVRDIAEWNGKPLSPGGQGTTNETMTLEMFEVLGIKPQWYRGGMNDMVQAFKDRRIIGFTKATALTRPDALIVDAMMGQPIRILSWSGDLVAKVQSKFPHYKTTRIPAGVWQGDWNKEPITTFGFATVLWTLAKLPEDLAYRFTKVVLEDKTEQVAAFPGLKDTDIGKLTIEQGGAPLHAGAVKALREAGHQVPQELLPPESR